MNRLTHQVLRSIPHRHHFATATRLLSNFTPNPNRKQRQQHSSLKITPDWRDLFRSPDYDDAWSPYVPIANSKPDVIKVNDKFSNPTQQSTVKSLVEGKWQKRRHGMNLMPLRMQLKDDVTSDDVEIQQATQQNEGRLRWLDSQTRFLSSMLDDLYRTGIRRQIDRGRTERCHRIIGKLLTLTPPLTSEDYSQLPFIFTGLAHRAASILDKMERCSPVALQHVNPDQINTDGLRTSARVGSTRLPQHLPYTKHTLPYPTPEIYNMVLLLHAKESGQASIAEQAEDVIWSMIDRFMQQKELEGNEEENSIVPSKENWDCVLRCWSKSTDSDRAFYALSFIESWKAWNEYTRRESNAEVEISEPDMASYHLLLECCLADSNDSRAIETGSKIAIQFWDEKKQTPLSKNFDSETYFLLLQSICQTKEALSKLKKPAFEPSFALAKRIFHVCCDNGLLTAEIIDVVRNVIPDKQFFHVIGGQEKFLDEDGNLLPSDELYKRVPFHWIIYGI